MSVFLAHPSARPPRGAPQLADPQWWDGLWAALTPGGADVTLTETTWDTDDLTLLHAPEIASRDALQWYRWLSEPNHGPEGAACTPEHFVRGILCLGSQKPVQTLALSQWIAWHGRGVRPHDVLSRGHPTPFQRAEGGARPTVWESLPPAQQSQLLNALLRKMGRWPAVHQQLIETVLGNAPAKLLGLTPASWDAVAAEFVRIHAAWTDRLEDAPAPAPDPDGTLAAVRARGVPGRLATWMCQTALGAQVGQLTQDGVARIQAGLLRRTDWPEAALRRYGTISRDDHGSQTLQRLQPLAPQHEAPVSLYHDWATTSQVHPLMQAQLCREALRLAARPAYDPDTPPVVHNALAAQVAQIIEQGMEAEVALLDGGSSQTPMDQGSAHVVEYWRRQLAETLQSPLLAPHLSARVHRRGLLHEDHTVRQRIIQHIGMARDATIQTVPLAAPTNDDARPAERQRGRA